MFGYTLQTEQIELKTGNIDGVLMYSESTEANTVNKPVLSLYGSSADQAVTIFNVETPTRPYEAANKKYVDSLYATSSGGSNWVKVYDGSNTIAEAVSSFEVNLSKSDPMKEFQLWLKIDKNTAADWGGNKNVSVKVNGATIGYFLLNHRLNSYVELYVERSLEAMTVSKRLLMPVRLDYNNETPMWIVGQGNKQMTANCLFSSPLRMLGK